MSVPIWKDYEVNLKTFWTRVQLKIYFKGKIWGQRGVSKVLQLMESSMIYVDCLGIYFEEM